MRYPFASTCATPTSDVNTGRMLRTMAAGLRMRRRQTGFFGSKSCALASNCGTGSEHAVHGELQEYGPPFPLTLDAARRDTMFAQDCVAGEYIQHFCPAAWLGSRESCKRPKHRSWLRRVS